MTPLTQALSLIRARCEAAYDDEFNTDDKWLEFSGNAQDDIRKLLLVLEKAIKQRDEWARNITADEYMLAGFREGDDAELLRVLSGGTDET